MMMMLMFCCFGIRIRQIYQHGLVYIIATKDHSFGGKDAQQIGTVARPQTLPPRCGVCLDIIRQCRAAVRPFGSILMRSSGLVVCVVVIDTVPNRKSI
jgi:hypothetical protein